MWHCPLFKFATLIRSHKFIIIYNNNSLFYVDVIVKITLLIYSLFYEYYNITNSCQHTNDGWYERKRLLFHFVEDLDKFWPFGIWNGFNAWLALTVCSIPSKEKVSSFSCTCLFPFCDLLIYIPSSLKFKNEDTERNQSVLVIALPSLRRSWKTSTCEF